MVKPSFGGEKNNGNLDDSQVLSGLFEAPEPLPLHYLIDTCQQVKQMIQIELYFPAWLCLGKCTNEFFTRIKLAAASRSPCILFSDAWGPQIALNQAGRRILL